MIQDLIKGCFAAMIKKYQSFCLATNSLYRCSFISQRCRDEKTTINITIKMSASIITKDPDVFAKSFISALRCQPEKKFTKIATARKTPIGSPAASFHSNLFLRSLFCSQYTIKPFSSLVSIINSKYLVKSGFAKLIHKMLIHLR